MAHLDNSRTLKVRNLDRRFIPEFPKLKKFIDKKRSEKKKIVLTQGVYDLIHEGHALYLEKARAHGDLLIVGVDSDELTRRRKGPDRPIVPQDERVKMLLHLRHVDVVTIRDADEDIGALINLVKPDVLIVSESTKDFTKEMVKSYGGVCGKIVTLPPQAATTTSARIRNLTIEGAEKLSREISKLTKDFIKNIKGEH